MTFDASHGVPDLFSGLIIACLAHEIWVGGRHRVVFTHYTVAHIRMLIVVRALVVAGVTRLFER